MLNDSLIWYKVTSHELIFLSFSIVFIIISTSREASQADASLCFIFVAEAKLLRKEMYGVSGIIELTKNLPLLR